MDRRDKTRQTEPRRSPTPAKAKLGGQIRPPREVEKPRNGPAGIPGWKEEAEPAEVLMPEPSEDFGERRDIETADEPVEQHDRRHHGGGRSDVESSEPG
jgi:hypothetical protein